MSYHLYNVVFGLILDTYCICVYGILCVCVCISYACSIGTSLFMGVYVLCPALHGLILYPPGFISKLIYVYHKCVPKCVVILPLLRQLLLLLSPPTTSPCSSLCEQKHFKYSKKTPHTHAQLAITQKHLPHLPHLPLLPLLPDSRPRSISSYRVLQGGGHRVALGRQLCSTSRSMFWP